MKDIIQKASDTDKQITVAHNAAPKAIAPSAREKAIAMRQSIWLSYLLLLAAISAGGLSIFSVAAILTTKPAQANVNEQSASFPAPSLEAQALPGNSRSSEYTCPVEYHQDLVKGESSQTTAADIQTAPNSTSHRHRSDKQNLNVLDALATSPAPNNEATTTVPDASGSAVLSAPQDLSKKDQAQPECREVNHTSTMLLEQTAWVPTHFSTDPVFTSLDLANVETLHQNISPELNLEPPVAHQKPTTVETTAAVQNNSSSLVAATTDSRSLLAQVPTVDKPTAKASDHAPSTPTSDPALSVVEGHNSTQPTVGDDTATPAINTPSTTTSNSALSTVEGNSSTPNSVDPSTTNRTTKVHQPTKGAPTVHKGPGGASLLGGRLQAQSIEDGRSTSTTPSQTAAQLANPLAPTLLLQGGFITQDETGARARLTGIYPISPNALFGGTVDLTTGRGFSDTPGTGLQLNELYFTGSLPSMPGLRLTVGLMDLTSYFDRNSFAKDSLTHFFNPVFQTNPALAAAGIGSRPGALLNWDITDNLQARAAAFSSSRSLGSFDIDAFAGELAFRAGNAIVRGTFVTDRDAGRDNGFNEIYGIPRSNGDFGIRSSDRENAYGINAEYFFPQIKLGLFGRYGHYENASLGRGGDTYSLGLNFLDLFMPNDRFGFGYGRDLSNNDLRRTTGRKVPDVWELFYDVRVLSNLRAAVTLQARDEFSDIVAGFRIRTEFDLLRGLFR